MYLCVCVFKLKVYHLSFFCDILHDICVYLIFWQLHFFQRSFYDSLEFIILGCMGQNLVRKQLILEDYRGYCDTK